MYSRYVCDHLKLIHKQNFRRELDLVLTCSHESQLKTQTLYATYINELRDARFQISICIRIFHHLLRFNSRNMSAHPTDKFETILHRK